jgi:hypothetical protein
VAPTINSYLTLNPENTSTNIQGQTVVVLDCLRNIIINSTAEQTSNQTFIINGYDEENVAVQDQIVIQASYDNIYTVKGFASILSVQIISSGSVGTFTVGTSNGISLPSHLCLSTQQIISVNYNNQPLTPLSSADPNSATEVGFFNNNWRIQAPSMFSYDARGIFILYTNPNGASVFSVLYWVYGADSKLQNALAANDYTAYNLIGYPSPGPYPTPPAVSPRPANTPPPLLVAGDETGIQYPGQMSEYNLYFNNPVT